MGVEPTDKNVENKKTKVDFGLPYLLRTFTSAYGKMTDDIDRTHQNIVHVSIL